MEKIIKYGTPDDLTGELLAGFTVKQTFLAESPLLSAVLVDFATYRRKNTSRLKVSLQPFEGESIFSTVLVTDTLQDNKMNRISVNANLIQGKTYTLVLEGVDGDARNAVTAKYGKKLHPDQAMWLGGAKTKNHELHAAFVFDIGESQTSNQTVVTKQTSTPKEVQKVVVPEEKESTTNFIQDLLSVCITLEKDQDAKDNSGLTFLQEMIQSFVDYGKDRRIELIIVDWMKTTPSIKGWLYGMAARYFPVNHIEMEGSYSWGRGADMAAKEARGSVLMFLNPHMIINGDVFATVEKVKSNGGAVLPESITPSPKWTYSQGNLIIHHSLFNKSPGWSDEGKMISFLNACGNCTRKCESGLRTLLQEEKKEPMVAASYVTLGAGKVATFCLALKSRSEMAKESVRSLVTDENVQFFDFIITEDTSDDMLDLSDFPLAKHIKHYVVDTGEKWNRSKLCNYGFARATTPVVVSWDADFVFPSDFAKNFLKTLVSTNFTNAFIRIPVTETDTMMRGNMTFQRGTLYGGMYAYGKKELVSIGGYDETFSLYGYEEKDANSRLVMAGVVEKVVTRKGYVFHKSHGDQVRGDMSNYNINKKKAEDHVRQRLVKVNLAGWGKAPRKKRHNYDQTIVVMGNGPSLKHFDFELMRTFDCIGMNIAYRHFRKIGVFPRYHTCFDRVVTDNHAHDFKEYIEDPSVTTERFFLLAPVTTSQKLTVIHLYPESYTFSTDLNHFTNAGNTGTNSCQVALCLGYKRIILIGVDCNYVQLVDGAKIIEGSVIEMQKTPDSNPNYFIPDYQQKGDRFNVPNAHIYHQPAWERFAKYALVNGIEVVNCGPESKLECFRRSTLEDEGIVL